MRKLIRRRNMKRLVKIMISIVLTLLLTIAVMMALFIPLVTQKIDLNTIIRNKELNEIYTSQKEKPTKVQILSAIKNKNDQAITLNVSDFDIKLENINENSMIIIGKGNYEEEVPLYYKSINFKKVSGWKSTNGEVRSLLNVNGTIYVGTSSSIGIGNVYISEEN